MTVKGCAIPGSNITNRHLIAVRLLSHLLLFYAWAPAPLLHSIRLKLENMRAMLPSSVLELEALWQSAVMLMNQKIADACAEDTTSRWMQHVFVEPNMFNSLCVVVIGEHTTCLSQYLHPLTQCWLVSCLYVFIYKNMGSSWCMLQL